MTRLLPLPLLARPTAATCPTPPAALGTARTVAATATGFASIRQPTLHVGRTGASAFLVARAFALERSVAWRFARIALPRTVLGAVFRACRSEPRTAPLVCPWQSALPARLPPAVAATAAPHALIAARMSNAVRSCTTPAAIAKPTPPAIRPTVPVAASATFAPLGLRMRLAGTAAPRAAIAGRTARASQTFASWFPRIHWGRRMVGELATEATGTLRVTYGPKS
jgi:hypothetical protein